MDNILGKIGDFIAGEVKSLVEENELLHKENSELKAIVNRLQHATKTIDKDSDGSLLQNHIKGEIDVSSVGADLNIVGCDFDYYIPLLSKDKLFNDMIDNDTDANLRQYIQRKFDVGYLTSWKILTCYQGDTWNGIE